MLAFAARARKEKAKLESISNALETKVYLENQRDRWVAAGNDEANIVNHPSDIEINFASGEAKYFTAITDEDRSLRKFALNYLDEGHAILERSVATIAEDGDDALLALGREFAVIRILIANELLPSRMSRPVPPEFTMSADAAAIYLDGDWKGMERLRTALALKLGVAT